MKEIEIHKKIHDRKSKVSHLWRKKRLSKKDRTDIYGCAAATAATWIFRSIA
jgi:hypothetical protein